MPEIQLRALTKQFSPRPLAVDRIDLTVRDGELLTLVGPSGSGKSTTLRLIAGLERPTSGSVCFAQRDVTTLSPRMRQVAMVFQGENHFPHLSVRDNLTIGLRLRREAAGVIERRLAEATEMLGLAPLLNRWPQELSGGERQRVAVARVLIGRSPVCLFDEPSAHVDPYQRGELRDAIRTLHARTGATMVYVTHDQAEAMMLGERMAVMEAGKILQLGTPQSIYERPHNRFVAGFIGFPPMNLFTARIQQGTLCIADQQLREVGHPEGDVWVGIRPERLRLGTEFELRLRGILRETQYLGAVQLAVVEFRDRRLLVKLPATTALQAGQTLDLSVPRQDLLLFAADEEGRLWGPIPKRKA